MMSKTNRFYATCDGLLGIEKVVGSDGVAFDLSGPHYVDNEIDLINLIHLHLAKVSEMGFGDHSDNIRVYHEDGKLFIHGVNRIDIRNRSEVD